ncbi:serine/threonine protein kinase [Hyalangium gracile]|uniref:serine/threonine protein kinase n=1 Tax=Hyalangium gracile TaxID=394092 RepID=UPI001CCF91EF|nr:serine/threonine-protein kinase [Hyalangium gracile]
MGKYQLVRRLATGGMAEVFLAKAAGPMGFEKELVVKRILPHLAEDPQFVEMFLSEAKLAARLNHGNVVQIFDFGEQEDSYFIAMEYVEGLDLRTLSKRALQRGTPISYPLITRIVSLACEGLAYAHELVEPQSGQSIGFIHRDISTDNILVSKTGGVKVVDFGIAKAANVGQQTRTGVLKGKLAYMPPEYLLGTPIDLRADIYALGVVLYELIAGRKPFVAESEAVLAQLIVQEPPPDIRTLRSGVPAPLVHVLGRALHKDREARYSSCRQMQVDLERFLFQCSEPVGALQIAELVKALFAVEASPKRRPSKDISGVALSTGRPVSHGLTRPQRAGPPIAALLPLRAEPEALPAPETEGPTEPLERSRITPASREDAEVEEVLRLVSRSRWHWPVALAVGLLVILAGVSFASFSTPERSSEDSASVAAREPLPEPPVAPAVEPSLPEPRALPVAPPAEPSDGAEGRSETPVTQPAPPADVSTSGTAKLVLLRVDASLPAQVWIDGTRKGPTPWEGSLKPGFHRIEIDGEEEGKQFNQVKSVRLVAGRYPTIFFPIQRAKVLVRGKPNDMKVLLLDGQPLEGSGEVDVYEGWHLLKLQHTPTGKIYFTECEAKAEERLCKFDVKLKR